MTLLFIKNYETFIYIYTCKNCLPKILKMHYIVLYKNFEIVKVIYLDFLKNLKNNVIAYIYNFFLFKM